MATDFSKYGEEITDLEAAGIDDTAPKSWFTRGLEFLVPSTKKGFQEALSGEQQSLTEQIKSGVGAGLELASFAVPAGKIKQGTNIVKGGVKQAFLKAGAQGKSAGITGAASGALFGAGRGLGEEDSNALDVAKSAASFGLAGGAGGALLAPAMSLTKLGVGNTVRMTSAGIRKANKIMHPNNKQSAVENIVEAYEKSFVEDKTAVNKALEKLWVSSRRAGGPDSSQGLIQELAEEGYLPVVDGQLAKMRPVMDALSDRIAKISNGIDSFLEPIPDKTPIDKIQKRATQKIKNRVDVDPVKAERDLKKLIKSIQAQFGDELSATDINAVRKEANQLTKKFKHEKLVQDTADIVGQTTREILDELVPSGVVRDANKQISKLFRMQKTAKVFNNRKIDAGLIGEFTGRMLGTAGGASLGIAVAGPGGLVVAGALANLGSRAVAQMVRKVRFNPQTASIIRQGLKFDDDVLKKLLREANPTDRATIKGLLGPGPIVTPAPERSAVKAISAEKAVGRDPKTGKFKKVFTQE